MTRPGRGSRVCVCGRSAARGRHRVKTNRPTWLRERRWGGRSGVSRPTVVDRTAGYPVQRCWCSVTPRFLHSGVAVAESADSALRRSRRARGSGRISDTRVFCAPAVTKLGMGLSVERDMADRPVHDRTRVRDGRAVSSRGARWSLGCLVDLVMLRSAISMFDKKRSQKHKVAPPMCYG